MECVYESSSYSRISYVKTPNVTYCFVDLRSCMCHDVLVPEVNIFIRNCKSRDSRPRPRLTSRDRDLHDETDNVETETRRSRPRLVQPDQDSKILVSSRPGLVKPYSLSTTVFQIIDRKVYFCVSSELEKLSQDVQQERLKGVHPHIDLEFQVNDPHYCILIKLH